MQCHHLDISPDLRYTYYISAFYPFFAQRAVFSLISESEVSLHAVFPPHRIRRRRAGAQQAPVRENDPDPRAEAHSRPRGPHHPEYAHHQHLQSGRHLLCGPAVHQRVGRGGRRVEPDGHHSGPRLHAGPRRGRHHQPQPRQSGHPCGHKVRLHQLLHGADLRRSAGRSRSRYPARLHDAAGQHRHHPAPRLRLRAAHPHRGPAHDVEPRDEQHPPLRGQGQLRHDRPRHRRCAQHRAGPRLHLRPRHGDRRRRHGHRSEPEHQLLHPAFHVSAGQDRQPIPHHPGHPQRPGLRADLLQRCAQLRPSGPEQHRQHAAERRRPQLRRRCRGRHEHRVPHLPVRAVGGYRRRTGPAACSGLQLRRPPLCSGAESGHFHHLDGFRLYGGAQLPLLVQRRAPHPPLPR